MSEPTLNFWCRKGYGKSDLKPIILKLYVNGTRSEKSTGIMVHTDHWSQEHQKVHGHPDAEKLNGRLLDFKRREEKKILQAEALEIPITRDIIKKKPGTCLVEYGMEVKGKQRVSPSQVLRIKMYMLYKKGVIKEIPEHVLRNDQFAMLVHSATVTYPRLSEITPEWLRSYRAFLEKFYKTNTVFGVFAWLSNVFTLAVGEGKILKNPFDTFDKPGDEDVDQNFLYDHERKLFQEMLEATPAEDKSNRHRTLVWFLFACNTGIRQSDWGKVDFENRYFQVNGSWLFGVRATKNGKWVTQEAGPTLQSLIARIREHNITPPKNLHTKNKNLKAMCKIFGITKKITSHTGRHTFGFRCASQGLAPHILAKLLGVRESTALVYYHLIGEDFTKQTAPLGKW